MQIPKTRPWREGAEDAAALMVAWGLVQAAAGWDAGQGGELGTMGGRAAGGLRRSGGASAS